MCLFFKAEKSNQPVRFADENAGSVGGSSPRPISLLSLKYHPGVGGTFWWKEPCPWWGAEQSDLQGLFQPKPCWDSVSQDPPLTGSEDQPGGEGVLDVHKGTSKCTTSK